MPTDEYYRWFDTTIGPRLRTAVSDITWPLYAERDSLRAALQETRDRIETLELERVGKQTEIDNLQFRVMELERLLAECEEPPPVPDPEPLPIPTNYNGSKIQIGWRTWERNPANLESWVRERKNRLAGIVVFGDILSIAGGRDAISHIRDMDVPVYPYVRALHMRVNPVVAGQTFSLIGSSLPFEHHVGQLVKNQDAYVRDTNGKVMWHSGGSDVYIDLSVIAEQHAQVVMDHLWDSVFSGILADGVIGGNDQIYADPPGIIDYDKDGQPDWQLQGWHSLVTRQSIALERWLNTLTCPVIGNGGWSPKFRSDDQITALLDGVQDEDFTHPAYTDADPSLQYPTTSQRWNMHIESALQCRTDGKRYWIGDRMRLFQTDAFASSKEQLRRFAITSALMVDGYPVSDDHQFFTLDIGQPIEEAHDNTGTMITDYSGDRAQKVWKRQFRNAGNVVRVVRCDPIARDGSIM